MQYENKEVVDCTHYGVWIRRYWYWWKASGP